MSLDPGTTLGIYQVTAKIGEGGMGEVYRARDTKLNRDVALKVLPDLFASDPDRLARFQREAEVLASLNHPNIATIHGLEETADTRALVLELVEGPTLAERIAQGPIPLDETVAIASQIADALEAAHEQGVIHRDLKPANVKVKDDGTVKVLDFRLAKALDPSPGGDPSLSPTLTAAATQMGMIMGTAAYMSPEQARGKPVDGRADIWAFGAVLYEMLSGQRLFQGDDVSLTLAKVLEKEPTWDDLPSTVPPRMANVIRRCLQKDPRQRVQAIGDVRLAMDGAFETTVGTSAGLVEVAPSKIWQRPAFLALAALVLVSGTGVAVWTATRPSPPAPSPVVRFAVAHDEAPELFIATRSPDIAISPTGEHIAYMAGANGLGAEQLRVRALDQLTSEMLAEGELNSPFFSPDGTAVGFYDRGGGSAQVMLRVSVLGGPVATICNLPGDLRGASWGMDGTIVFGSAETSTGLWRVAAVGGEPEVLTTPDPEQGEIDHFWPELLPDGESVVFTVLASPNSESTIEVLSLETGERKVILRGGTFPRFVPTGHLVYQVAGNLWAVGFDLGQLETVGDPVPVLEGVTSKLQGAADVGVSHDGVLIYVPGTGVQADQDRRLVWVDRAGREEPISAPAALYETPRLSPDGRLVALELNEPANSDVIIYDLQRETSTRLTFDPASDTEPLWSPDGQRVLFASSRDGGAPNVYAKAADGTGSAERLTTSDSFQRPHSWSADGQSLIIIDARGGNAPGSPAGVAVVSLGAEDATDGLLETQFDENQPAVSPDGRWIAYRSNESGQSHIYVRPFPNVDDGKWQISRNPALSPVWAADGSELFFEAFGVFEILAVPVTTEPTFVPGNPEALFGGPYRLSGFGRSRAWDVGADGRFLIITADAALEDRAAAPRIVVVQNWFQELIERVPVP